LISIRHRTLADLTPYYSRRLNPKMLNGARKILSNLVLNFVTYLRDTSYLKNADYVQGQGAGRRKSGVRQSTLADERSF
jgi:hypothetical protein